MLKSLNTAATGMEAQQTNMDVIANNMANVSTTGFKKTRAEFEDLMYQTVKEPGSRTGENSLNPNGVQVGLGVKTAGTQKDFTAGSPKLTRNPLDLQINGKGFFTVRLPNGNLAYTRDGAFKKSAEGLIVDKNGYALEPQINLPPTATSINIAADGQIAITSGQGTQVTNIGQLELSSFVNPSGLKAMGKKLIHSHECKWKPNPWKTGGSRVWEVLMQGQLEASNVNIVDEMVNMITAQRAYETNSKVVQAADQMLQQINTLR